MTENDKADWLIAKLWERHLEERRTNPHLDPAIDVGAVAALIFPRLRPPLISRLAERLQGQKCFEAVARTGDRWTVILSPGGVELGKYHFAKYGRALPLST
jgi:hypothetical protein